MKKNKILLTILASACVGMAAGCGETKYSITTKVNSSEESYVTGGGKYANGKKVSLKVYPTEGCFGTETNPKQYPKMEFTRQGQTEVTKTIDLTNLIDGKYYLYEFTVDNNAETGNVGTYNVICSCATRTSDEASDAKATKFDVTYYVKDSAGKVTSFSKEVKYGGVAENITAIEGKEGLLKWYKDDEYKNEYLFRSQDIITSNLNLYSMLDDDPASIIKAALESFKDVKNLVITHSDGSFAKMTDFNKYYSTNPDEKKNFFFDYYKDAAGTRDFYVTNNLYYAFDGSYSYKVNLNGNSFGMTLEDVNNFTKFFDHLDIDTTDEDYTYERETYDDNGIVKDKIYNVVVGKDEDDEDIVEKCYRYLIKRGTNTVYELYMHGGKIYKTLKVDGNITKIITYPEEGSKTNPGATKEMYLLKLQVHADDLGIAPDLQDKVLAMNKSFETLLKVKEGETLAEVILKNTELNNLLKKYTYRLLKGAGTPVPLNSPTAVNSNGGLTIDISASAQVVFNAVDTLNTDGFKISTSLIWDEADPSGTVTIQPEYEIAPGGIDSIPAALIFVTKDTLSSLRDLSNGAYDSFSYNSDTGEYEFYDKDCSVPFLRIKINATSGKIEKVTYYDFENANIDMRNSYISTFQ